MNLGLLIENIKISASSIKSNLLRTSLTILIITFGIMALIGILTAIDAISFSLKSNFSSMGSNTFTIENRTMQVHAGRGKRERFENITVTEAHQFKQRYDFPATASLHSFFSYIATVKYGSEETHPNVSITGIDEHYIETSGYNIEKGRNFSPVEVLEGRNVIIIGKDIEKRLFSEYINPINQQILVGSMSYIIVGVLEEKGSTFGFSGDNICLIPLNNARKNAGNRELNYTISVMVSEQKQMETAINEATQLFRIIRKIPPGSENNFAISKSSSLGEMLLDNIKYITIAATLIGLITLVGASIGLMNIMMVTVTERTKEIGLRKAIGATTGRIKNQFLIEAIVIGQIGGILGIIFGIAVGNFISIFIGSPFIMPWTWIITGVFLCLVVGVLSGLYPAIKASKLDPVIALRYE